MSTEPAPVPAPIIWNNTQNMIVLCPFCKNPDYVKFTARPIMALCNQGKYLPKGRFDFELATRLLEDREKWNAYKKDWRRKAKEMDTDERAKQLPMG
jgi:hypothetical protein